VRKRDGTKFCLQVSGFTFVVDSSMMDDSQVPEHLKLYHDSGYFVGTGRQSGYSDYAKCRGVLDQWCEMLRYTVGPIDSVLDVAAAYGFVVENFRRRGVPAWGVEPSDFARSQANPAISQWLLAGALPELPDTLTDLAPLGGFDVVTCTECLEHVPEELVPASLQALAQHTARVCVSLTMLECPEAHHDEGHICLKDRAWWEAHWDATGLVADRETEEMLNTHPYSKFMNWSGRLFVRVR
jgi:2-polyprenyl-3-methyl-5-hydroxy-6-metoxy-1,4-benzoquinol methylase